MSSYSEGQTHQLMERLEAEGFTSDDVTKLGQYKNLPDFRGVLRGTHEIVPVETELLLEFLGTVTVPASGNFIAKDHFVVNTGRKAKVKISYLGDNLTEWFLGEDGKVEAPISEQTLRYARLKKASVDGPIITEIGGEVKAETTLTEMFSSMEKQKNGETGTLLNNGYANIFYIRDKKGVLRAVYVRWFGDGWFVNAHFVGDPDWWLDGYQVFSRIPVAA